MKKELSLLAFRKSTSILRGLQLILMHFTEEYILFKPKTTSSDLMDLHAIPYYAQLDLYSWQHYLQDRYIEELSLDSSNFSAVIVLE